MSKMRREIEITYTLIIKHVSVNYFTIGAFYDSCVCGITYVVNGSNVWMQLVDEDFAVNYPHRMCKKCLEKL